MSTNKNIEEVFNELSNYEEMPSQDLWQKIALGIPTYPVSSPIASVEHTNASSFWGKMTSFVSSTKGMVLVAAISSSFVGGIIMYQSNNEVETSINEVSQPQEITEEKTTITQPQNLENDLVIQKIEGEKSTEATKITEISPSKTTQLSEPKEDLNLPITTPVVVKDSIVQTVETTKLEQETKTSKPESFYEKKVRLMKDSTRNVFKPE